LRGGAEFLVTQRERERERERERRERARERERQRERERERESARHRVRAGMRSLVSPYSETLGYHTVEYDPFIKSQLASRINYRALCGAILVTPWN